MSEKRTVYLDNNATTMVDPEVVKAMLPYFTEYYGNASSMHDLAIEPARAVAEARHKIAEYVGAEYDSEIIFTSCATESDSTAIYSAIECNPEKREIITTPVEHPAILRVLDHLEEDRGYKITKLHVDSKGRLDLDEYKKALNSNVALVTCMWANNETGNIYPVTEMAHLAHEQGIMFHSDGVQAMGKVDMDLKSTDIDMLSFSGHKLHAPKGIGVFYLKRSCRFRPFLRGGHQESGRRAGTENVPYIVGLGKACELSGQHVGYMRSEIKRLRDRLEQGILAKVPDCFVTGDPDNRSANTSNIAFQFVEGEGILLKLNEYGICASSGSACTSGSLDPSHVMKAMGIPFTAAHGTIRFSLSRFATEADIDYTVEKVPEIIAELRSFSPYWRKDGSGGAESFDPNYGEGKGAQFKK